MMTIKSARVWLLGILVVAASVTCREDVAGPLPQPATVRMVAGDNQVGQLGQPLADSLEVKVEDAQGQPVAGVAVDWTLEGGGSVSQSRGVSGTDGMVEVQRVLGGTAGPQTTTATVAGLPGVVFTAMAEASGQPRLTIATQPSGAAQDGVSLEQQPVVQAQGADGQPLGAGVPVTATTEGGAALSGTTVVQSDGSGRARFTDLALSGPSGSYTLTFSAPDLGAVRSTPISLSTTMGALGQWTPPFAWPIVAIHVVLLPDGRVLSIGRTGTPEVWDPATNAFTSIPSPARLFCAGHVLLADGNVLVVGGHIKDGFGLPNMTVFSGATNAWTSDAPMPRGRWYPTATVTGTGEVVILAGTDEDSADVSIPEVWNNGSLRELTGADHTFGWYPRAFLTPDGRIYVAGAAIRTRFLSLSGTGSWTNGPMRLYGIRDYGSAVMYDDGKVIYAGGGLTTNTAELIDLNQATPSWQWTGSMAYPRRHLNLTVLPTGEVLATGGVAGTTFDDVTKPVHAAELWDPATGKWTTLASNAVTRGYHGTSLLLPDGRVLNAGSGEGAGAPDERNAELFAPPYLFRGPRPEITNAPSEVSYGAHFRIETPQASAITHVSLIRLGAVTHAFDQNQRFLHLAFTADASGLTVTAPSEPNRAPPGHYMVFILNGSDVPSVARIVRLF